MTRKLRAVSSDGSSPKAPPESLAEAAADSRRAYLVMQRQVIDDAITDGVPAHALARLIATAGEIDAEIRRMDERDRQETEHRDEASDGAFDASAI